MGTVERITVRLDIESRGGWVHLEEQLDVEMEHKMWMITNPKGHEAWIGYGQYKNDAILNYLKARLGLWDVSKCDG